ncbi:MAG: transposase [Firmicutes bacterium]|nr:transposase [Bacillota bacterium]
MNEADNRGRLPVRKQPRLKGYDYSTPNYYFITICCHEMHHLFGKPGCPNRWGSIAAKGLEQIEKHHPGIRLDKYVIMPNHLHAILILDSNVSNISVAIGQYKSYVTSEIRKSAPKQIVWQRYFHDHIIRNQEQYEKIWLYIHSNPANWEKDRYFNPEIEYDESPQGDGVTAPLT